MIMGIEISIQAGLTKDTSRASGWGSERHVITGKEVESFKITDKPLKAAIKEYFGKSPNDAFLHSPTPWNDLYTTYGWPQVQTVLDVDKVTILDVTSEPVIVAQQAFKNESKVPATFNCGISQSVTDTSSSTWSHTEALTFSQKITYKVGIVGGDSTFTFAETFGQNTTETKTVTLGATSGVSVPLSPGQSVLAVLKASRGVMKVQVDYRAYLIGDTAVNYNPEYQGHHFWALPIGNVMAAGGISNVKTVTEYLEIGFYADSETKLLDLATGEELMTFNLLGRPGAVSMEEVAALGV
jgi:hypothetical protein